MPLHHLQKVHIILYCVCMSPSLSEFFFHNKGLFYFLYLISCGKVTEVSELIYDFALQLPKRYIHQCTYTTVYTYNDCLGFATNLMGIVLDNKYSVHVWKYTPLELVHKVT